MSVFSGPPSLEEVIRVVNSNSSAIHRLQAIGATLTIPGQPVLRAELALERPQRFRLRADTSFTGSELDLGSNNELFWIWVKRSQPAAVYYCRHDQLLSSSARQILPVEPGWLISAMGLTHLDPAARHSDPTPLGEDRLEVRSILPTILGDVHRIMIIHDTYGWVLEQHLVDMQGHPLASAVASNHQHDPATGSYLPRHGEIRLPQTGMEFTVDVAGYLINRIDGDGPGRWTLPQPTGYPLVNLADPAGPGIAPVSNHRTRPAPGY